jgi:hypothetical protein
MAKDKGRRMEVERGSVESRIQELQEYSCVGENRLDKSSRHFWVRFTLGELDNDDENELRCEPASP